MIINHNKEKTYNAITYFVENTILCNKKKTYKLLYFLDFLHFEKTGRSVTGFEYYAWDMGPVPKVLHQAIQNNDEELLEHFEIEHHFTGEYESISLKSRRPFERKYFSRRELKLLEEIATNFYMQTGKEMEDFTHREGTPWHRVYKVEENRNGEIPYAYQLDDLEESERYTILSISEERKSFFETYK